MKTGLLGHFGYSLEYLSDFKELCQFFSFFWAENLYTTFPSLPSKSHAIQIILLKKKKINRSIMLEQFADVTDITIRKMFWDCVYRLIYLKYYFALLKIFLKRIL